MTLMEMVSACPACLTMVNHEDHIFEVQCSECGTRFNPFLPSEGMPEPQPNLGPGPSTMAGLTADLSGFNESTNAFREIRDFGETLGKSVIPQPTKSTPRPSSAPDKSTSLSTPAELDGEDLLATSGDTLQGYTIDAYLPPISTITEFDAAAQNPLKTLFGSLRIQAKGVGATAVLSVRWAILPDGTKVVASGTPVRCSKQT